ncbi:gluconokinase [Pseudomonas sp. GGS8]|uniref:gluconokinase n=1 Tax=Pseudomonas sp. GGS8 TaxID=2817892 RepID=UPI00209D19B5|nr:gluconokinase [Pseudomonas sp. GGS8]MCP1445157.1 gluconokinase [Pseudomonas sp. GGS8]
MSHKIDRLDVSDPGNSSVAVVVMGVAGCGKSSVARAIADALDGMLIEGDAFHPQENIRKMRQGISLTDLDRAAWLTSLNQALHGAIAAGRLPILACSALKQCYRDVLENGIRSVAMVFLRLPESVAAARVSSRTDHYMPATLVASQFTDLEPPQAGRNVIDIDATLPLPEVVMQFESWWRRRQ